MTGVHDPGGGIERDDGCLHRRQAGRDDGSLVGGHKTGRKEVGDSMKTGQRRQVDETVRSVGVELDFPLHLLVDAAQVHLPACQRLDIQTAR